MDDKLRLLLSTSAELAKERDIRSILVKLTSTTKLLLSADRCGIFLHDKDNKQLWTIVADGVDEIRMPEDKGIGGYVLKHREVLNVPDAYALPYFNQQVDRETGYRTKSMLAMPLYDLNGDPIGVFQVVNKLDNQPFTEEDVDVLRHVALYAASAIESALLYDKLRKAHEDVVYKLSHATKFKDPETKNHIVRVGLYCGLLGESLGWKDEEVETVRLAAPMHDIGKVGVPDVILQKPAALDDEEWVVMKRHTVYGYEILEGAESRLLEVAALLTLEHHEKWNGKGYPNGKSKDETSIHGRMTALADVFDALTSKRHYKPAWPRDKVLSLFREERGQHFDPQLADIFLDRFDEMYAIKERFRDEEQ